VKKQIEESCAGFTGAVFISSGQLLLKPEKWPCREDEEKMVVRKDSGQQKV